GVGLLGSARAAEESLSLTSGDAALLRFPAALELIEADFWIQYNELGGIQDSEVPGGTGNPDYTEALAALDEDMDQYIHDNTDDENYSPHVPKRVPDVQGSGSCKSRSVSHSDGQHRDGSQFELDRETAHQDRKSTRL